MMMPRDIHAIAGVCNRMAAAIRMRPNAENHPMPRG
jgi:hypothetical protein